MMRMQTKFRSESGASAVEFALLLPVLMMVLFGIIEFGFGEICALQSGMIKNTIA